MRTPWLLVALAPLPLTRAPLPLTLALLPLTLALLLLTSGCDAADEGCAGGGLTASARVFDFREAADAGGRQTLLLRRGCGAPVTVGPACIVGEGDGGVPFFLEGPDRATLAGGQTAGLRVTHDPADPSVGAPTAKARLIVHAGDQTFVVALCGPGEGDAEVDCDPVDAGACP